MSCGALGGGPKIPMGILGSAQFLADVCLEFGIAQCHLKGNQIGGVF